MTYLDFELRVGVGKAGAYPAVVLRSPVGEASDEITRLPLDDPAFRARLQSIEQTRRVVVETRRLAPAERHLRPDPPWATTELDDTKAIGCALFEALFPPKLLTCYRRSCDAARVKGHWLRLRLRIEPPELAALPWEFLFDQDDGDYVALNPKLPLSRYLELSRPLQSLVVPPPIRILGMIASPHDLPALDVATEQQHIEDAVARLRESGTVEIAWVNGQTLSALDGFLRESREKWHIFHFIGHGGFDPRRGEGLIALADGASGNAEMVSATEFGRLLAWQPSLRLVVINACEGARADKAALFSSTGAVLVQRGVPAVVSMQYAISDQAANEFALNFYDALARKLPVDASVTEARYRLSLVLHGSGEWGTPVLHMRAPDGNLFDLCEESAVFLPPESLESLSERSAVAAPEQPPPSRPQAALPPTPQPTAETERGLRILRSRVQRYWIQGVLETSLFQDLLIDLGMSREAAAVDHPWARLLERPGADSRTIPAHSTIANVFDQEGGSLLILGEPGSGKTTTMLGLARALISRSEQDPGSPIPVVLNLSSWVEPYRTITDWLVDELSAKYLIPKQAGRAWLQENRLLPLFDGLDELRPERRTVCVRALNLFAQEAGLMGIVVCCRLREYIELPVRLLLQAAVRLQPLTDAAVEGYLAAAGERLSSLRLALQRDSALRIDARSPLMLNLMARAYEDATAEQVLRDSANTIELQRKRVMNAYVANRVRHASQRGSLTQDGSIKPAYGEAQSRRWLAWLARGMARHGQTIFLMEQLQPSWMTMRPQHGLYTLASRLLWGLMAGSLAVLIVLLIELTVGQPEPLLPRLRIGLIGGLILGLADLAELAQQPPRRKRAPAPSIQRLLGSGAALWASAGLVYGLTGDLKKAPLEILGVGLIYGLLFALVGGVVWLIRSAQRTPETEIRTLETLAWSWPRARKSGRSGLLVGLAFGLLLGLLAAPIGRLSEGLPPTQTNESLIVMAVGLLGALLFGLLFGVLVGVFGGLGPVVREMRTRSNQGMRLSLRNALLVGGIAGLMGLGLAFVAWPGAVASYKLACGATIGLCAGLWYGGLDAIQHGILRLILRFSGSAPLNYAPFLDYAANELNLLQKVGGGYVFIHRYVLEHFAGMDEGGQQVSSPSPSYLGVSSHSG